MPAIDELTAPLLLQHPNGQKQVVAACFPHPLGLLYLDLYWHLSTPDKSAHLLKGTLSGDGPWKVGNTVIRVLGCQGTDPEVQDQYSQWQHYLTENADRYPPPEQLRDIARKLGATPTLLKH